ncbi:hypothetical protein Y032_0283g1329 [Ancylostoma ceylanicum]|uniref:Uncharacterized protein n=1 Tax=Ancylostoma ceylanicum TaxID=53326 RepID=A0A016S6D4_9BILA|nr:hypothetical protein Y032_0283g1329 [Ancylostoma ceylanicum]
MLVDDISKYFRGISRAPLVLLTSLLKYPGVLKSRGSVTLKRQGPGPRCGNPACLLHLPWQRETMTYRFPSVSLPSRPAALVQQAT